MTDTNSRRRIAVTGLGAVCCAGDDVDSLWQAVLQGKSFATWINEPTLDRRIAACQAVAPACVTGRVRDFSRLDRFAQLGVAAGYQAWSDANLEMGEIEPSRVAVISGTSRGPVGLRRRGRSGSRVRPTEAVYNSVSSLTGTLASLIGARGPSSTVSATCASSAVAIGQAALQLASRAADAVLVGGADAPLHPGFLEELLATGVLGSGDTPEAVCRPFDLDRRGILIGEAGAYLVLERTDKALARGARIRAVLEGWGSSCDPGRRSGMSEDARGIRDAVEATLQTAGRTPDDVDAVHLHGTGTPINDRAEAEVLRNLFGHRSASVPCTSTKAVTGHCLGASGALQAVINVRALEDQCLPPTVGCIHPDPACAIRLIREAPCREPIRTILTHSAGFWGHHAGLLFGRSDDRQL